MLNINIDIPGLIRHTCETCQVPELASQIRYEFSNRMTRARGMANYQQKLLKFSYPLYLRSTQEGQVTNVIHETCHLIANYRHGRVQPHGYEWARYMELCGLEPITCHNVDRTGLARQVARVEAKCLCKTHTITKTRATKMRRGSVYVCRQCKGRLILV